METQSPSQSRPQREYPFKPGKSGNPSGRTRAMDRLVDLVTAFEATHRRPPSPLELVSLRAAAKLAAAASSQRTSATEAVRAANTLHRTLKRLGLASPPAKPKPAGPEIPSTAELIAGARR